MTTLQEQIEAERTPETGSSPIIIATGATTRLSLSRWDAPSGRSLVALTPEYQDRQGRWHLAHSAVSVPPEEAPRVAAALVGIAANISRMP